MIDSRPGLDVRRVARLCREAVERCELDLSGVRVLTEAATGAYVVTPVLAALAGATVRAVTRNSRYGSVAEVRAATSALAELAGADKDLTVLDERRPEDFAWADVVTNSGHLRPITGEIAAAIRPGAALTLMFEAWEIQAGRLDLSLAELVGRGVQVAGTNERHPHVAVFDHLGPMAVAQLADAGVSAYLGRIGVLCDNPFRPHLVAGLSAAGATVHAAASVGDLLAAATTLDAVVVALRPTGASVLGPQDLAAIAARHPDAVLTQFWGDLDRDACVRAGVAHWPLDPPPSGHMGVLPSRLGPEPIVRLQAGGLKVAQVLLLDAARRTPDDLAYLDPITQELH